MSYFKKHEYALDLSQQEVNAYLNKITKQKGKSKKLNHRFSLFKGRVKRNSFDISFNRYFQPVTVSGTIEAIAKEKTKLQLNGKFVWRHRIMNTLLFASVTAVLTLLCYLLLQENLTQGIFASLVSIVLSFALYRSLIGGMRKYYRKICSDLVHLLSVSATIK